MMELLLLALAVVSCIATTVAVYVYVLYARNTRLILDLQHQLRHREVASKAVIKGQVAEQMYPLHIKCPFDIQDMKFFGQPFDYIVLKGYSNGAITEIIFADIKTGSARLSSVQRSMRECIEAGRISWQTIRGDTTDAG